MASSRDVYDPNPLRPYYRPPTIGPPPAAASKAAATNLSQGTTPKSSFRFPDLDYSDYIPETSPSTTESLKDLIDKAVWKYTSVLIAQPFEVAKTLLQVYVPPEDDDSGNIVSGERGRASYSKSTSYRAHEEDVSSDDEPNYFASSGPTAYTASTSPPRGRPTRRITDRDGYVPPQSISSHGLLLKNHYSLMDALASLSSSYGALAMWKGTNATFVLSILSRTTETFLRSFIAAVFALPDSDLPSVSTSALPAPDMLSTAFPVATILVTAAASVLSSIILAPIDTARTRLMLTPSSHGPRSLFASLKHLPTPYTIPSHLVPITALHSLIPSVISTSTPLVLKSYLSIDPILTPTTWSIATFLGSSLDMAIRLPLETVLRRAQIATFTSPAIKAKYSRSSTAYTSTTPPPKCQTIVPVQQNYRGILGTGWSIVHEEGYSIPGTTSAVAASTAGRSAARRRKGQGIEGLYRGWRVGMWGLVGVWGAGWMGGMAAGPAAERGSAGVGSGGHGGKF